MDFQIISTLLRPRNWKPPVNRRFFLDSYEVGELCYAAEQIFMNEPTVLQLKAPTKLFGDLHGQFGDLMRLFDEYGYPSTTGDITYIDYLFLGDYVDRGQHSLETITLLLALKIEYPENVHLICGNHEAADINALFGFHLECIERMYDGENDGIWAWTQLNQLFNYLPLAALIEKKIIYMHGGIGRSIHKVEHIEKLKRPITMDVGSLVLMDLLWSDPTENDSVEGLRHNARGPGLVTFGMFIEEVMELVELSPLMEALVGLPGIDGLSTEQRKRLTIAVELVANPSIIFMDEPTLGLDARAATIVMRTVRNTVDTGRTVVCTIHQPSVDIFDAFDELLLLKCGGEEIYVGPLGHLSCHLIEYFEGIGGVT
ncbi:serine/threonine-protein phosphatase BSL1-like [Apium graveolens]|uniref:serine/threonine-protein phosphatase BSL1-like n=1 Tax=Apium graveolens TaxID=4045 RepID=UPI003D7A61AB